MSSSAAVDAVAKQRIQLDATTWVDLWRGWLADDGRTYRELATG